MAPSASFCPVLTTIFPPPPSTDSLILPAPSHRRAPASVPPLSGMAFEGHSYPEGLISGVTFSEMPSSTRQASHSLESALQGLLLSIIFPVYHHFCYYSSLSCSLHLCHSLLCIVPLWGSPRLFPSWPPSQPQLSYLSLFLFPVGTEAPEGQGTLVLSSNSSGLNMVPGSLKEPRTCLLSGWMRYQRPRCCLFRWSQERGTQKSLLPFPNCRKVDGVLKLIYSSLVCSIILVTYPWGYKE